MDMANLFKHFFREFSTFLVFCVSLGSFSCVTKGVESFCLEFELIFDCAQVLIRLFFFSVFLSLFFTLVFPAFRLWVSQITVT